MTGSPPNSKTGSTASASTPGPKDGQTTPTTTSRSDKPHGLCGRTGIHRGPFTPEELEETRRSMLKVSYADIEREFLEACGESRTPRTRKRLQ
jgi:hypothetical protein